MQFFLLGDIFSCHRYCHLSCPKFKCSFGDDKIPHMAIRDFSHLYYLWINRCRDSYDPFLLDSKGHQGFNSIERVKKADRKA